MTKKDKTEKEMPAWLRFMLIIIVILSLVAIMTGRRGPQREDFPARHW